jgi:protein AATF/BFR2
LDKSQDNSEEDVNESNSEDEEEGNNESNDSEGNESNAEDEEVNQTDESNDSEVFEFYSDNIRAPIASIDEYDNRVSNESHFNSSESSLENESEEQSVEELNDEKVHLNPNDINDEYINQFSNIDVSDEIAKGIAVKNQLLIWDNLLECRIKLQKLLIDSNKMPQFDYLPILQKSADSQLNDSLKNSSKAVKKLLNLLLDIDQCLDSQNNMLFNENNSLGSKSKDENNENEEITSDEEKESEISIDSPEVEKKIQIKRKLNDSEYPEFLAKRHCNLVSIRNDIIDKWYERTRFTSSSFKQKSFSALEQSSTKQISQILSDMERLIKRTQIKRSLYNIIGKTNQNDETLPVNDSNDQQMSHISKNNDKEIDPEIFDDDDFYHQLLRELIETKTSSDMNDPIALSRKWIEIQKLRNKMKRKVDTKASKGRKVRYDVHSKLVNFMAPIDYSTYSEEAKNDLFNSLFGKNPIE